MKRASKTQITLIVLTIVACAFVFYAVGIATNFFASPMFSMFFVISYQTAHNIVFYLAAAAAVALGIAALSVGIIQRRRVERPPETAVEPVAPTHSVQPVSVSVEEKTQATSPIVQKSEGQAKIPTMVERPPETRAEPVAPIHSAQPVSVSMEKKMQPTPIVQKSENQAKSPSMVGRLPETGAEPVAPTRSVQAPSVSVEEKVQASSPIIRKSEKQARIPSIYSGIVESLTSETINSHVQLYENSDIPSAVEVVLKLLRRVKPDYYALQKFWGNREGSFSDINGETIEGITFKLVDGLDTAKLFERINNELKEERYVIIPLLDSPNKCHTYVIYDYNEKKADYEAFTKIYQQALPQYIDDVRQRVKAMGKTDILVYSEKKR